MMFAWGVACSWGAKPAMDGLTRRVIRTNLRRAFAGCRPPCCFKCGYDLRGCDDRAKACPECGHTDIFGAPHEPASDDPQVDADHE